MRTLRTAVLIALLLPALGHATSRDGYYETYVTTTYEINLHGHYGHISPNFPDKSEIFDRLITRLELILDRWRDRWGRGR